MSGALEDAEAASALTLPLSQAPSASWPSSRRVISVPRSGRWRISPAHLFEDRVRMPTVTLATQRATPGVQRVVQGQGGLEQLLVIADVGAQPERNREQPRGLRRSIERVRVGGAHDLGEPRERGLLEVILVEKGIEAAQRAGV